MDFARSGMGKLKGVLKWVAIGETLIWALLGIVTVVGLFTTTSVGGEEMWSAGGIVILLGLGSGVTLFFATQREQGTIYRVWFGQTIVLLLCLSLGVILSLFFLGRNYHPSLPFHAWFWVGLTFFVLLIPNKIYCFLVVWKFYEWSTRAGFGNVVSSTIP